MVRQLKRLEKKLIVGIDEKTDILKLLNFGIRQFYFGYLQTKFINKYNSKLSINRRDNIKEQFTNIDNIYEVISILHKHDAIIYLTLNHLTSNQIMLEESKNIYELFKDKVDGIIVSNITIATYLKNEGYKKIVTSNLFGSYSIQSVEFLITQFNPIKIILPRDMQLDDIKTIVTKFPDMNFECFLFGDGCRFSESFCFVDYGDDDLSMPTLCSYANDNYKIVKKANPAFKMVVKDTTFSEDEKIQNFQTKQIDINSLLDELFILYDKFDSKNIAYKLDMLARLDIEEFYKNELIYTKAKMVFKTLEQFLKAEELLEQLKKKEFSKIDKYKQYHRINEYSIKETIDFFKNYKNIVSYKIPSRGRNIEKMLELFTSTKSIYNYKESMYKL